MNPARTPQITVVIAAYNRPDTLTWAVGSMLAQTFEDWEALIVLDHANAETLAAARAFDDPRLRVLNLPLNIGEQSGPNNVGASLAQGRYIAFLNHDDFWLPDHLATLWAIAGARNAQVVLSQAFGVSRFNPDHTIFPDTASTHLMTTLVRGRYRPNASFCGVTNWLVAIETYRALGGLRSALECRIAPSEDFLRRYVRKGGKPVIAPQATSVVMHSGLRGGSYVSGASREHQVVGEWLAGRPVGEVRERLLARLFQKPSDAPIPRLAAWLGLPVRLIQMTGEHQWRKGQFVNGLRRTRGLTPLSRNGVDERSLKLRNGVMIGDVAPGRTFFPGGAPKDRWLCFDGWHAPDPHTSWTQQHLAWVRWRWRQTPGAIRVTARCHLRATRTGWQLTAIGAGLRPLQVRWVKTPAEGTPITFDTVLDGAGLKREQALWLWTLFLPKATAPDKRRLGLALGELALLAVETPKALPPALERS